ncbi:MAG: GspH/FimT family pseudopilin [Candidatus Brocadiaceae bacterium]
MNSNKRGFSLIEMTIAVAIIAVLTGVAIPVYISMKSSIQLSGATRQIMEDLMWARMRAINQNNEFKVFFMDDHQYKILDDNNDNGDIDAGESVITKNIRDKYNDITLSSNNNPIFHPRGNAAPTATVTIVNSCGTKTVAIAITGRVRKE